MKLNLAFTIAAVLLIVLGLASLIAPEAMIVSSGMDASPSSGFAMAVRFLGVEWIGLGLIAWFVRNADASKARDGVVLGFTIYFALHALTSLYGQFTDTTTSMHWLAAAIQALLAIVFFMAGRAAMLKSAS